MERVEAGLPQVFTHHTICSLLDLYGYPRQGAVDVSALPQGVGGGVARVRTDGYDLVAKLIGKHTLGAADGFALEFHDRFAVSGMPCPRLHRTRSGDLCARVGDSTFSIQDWCAGEQFDPSDADEEACRDHRRAIGELLGRAHLWASDRFGTRPSSAPFLSARTLFEDVPDLERVLRWRRGGRLMRDLWIVTHECRQFAAELQNAVRLVRTARTRLKNSNSRYDPRFSFVLPVHGDMHFENVLFDKGTIVGVIDFDNAVLSPQVYDLGSTMGIVCDQRQHEQEFLEAYASIAGETLLDHRLLHECVLLRVVRSLTAQVSRYVRRVGYPPEKARYYIRRLIRTLETELTSS